MITKDFNQAWKQINTLILYVSHFENALSFVIQEIMLVDVIISMITVLDNHVVADGHQEWQNTLFHNFLDIWSLY